MCNEKYHFSKQCATLKVDKEEAKAIIMEKFDRLKELFKKDIDKSVANHETIAAILAKTLNDEFIKKCTKKCPCCSSIV